MNQSPRFSSRIRPRSRFSGNTGICGIFSIHVGNPALVRHSHRNLIYSRILRTCSHIHRLSRHRVGVYAQVIACSPHDVCICTCRIASDHQENPTPGVIMLAAYRLSMTEAADGAVRAPRPAIVPVLRKGRDHLMRGIGSVLHIGALGRLHEQQEMDRSIIGCGKLCTIVVYSFRPSSRSAALRACSSKIPIAA